MTNLDDSGPGSLRQAILDANAAAALISNTIVFQPGLTGMITLTSNSPKMDITSRLIINGPGKDVLAIGGNKPYGGIFEVTGAEVTIQGLTLKNSTSAITNFGSLTLNNLILSGNEGYSGPAINNSGKLIARNLILYDNSTIHGGGAIYNSGILNLGNSTLAGNRANGEGGGLYNHAPGTVTVYNTTFSANAANYGGGIFNGSCDGYMSCSDPQAKFTTVNVVNSTLTGNIARISGGGIYNNFWEYDGELRGTGTLYLGNSIVAGNTAPTASEAFTREPYKTVPSLTSQGNNLLGKNRDPGVVGVTLRGTDLTLTGAVDTAIEPLDDNGGPTPTHLLAAGSPAIDKGSNPLAIAAGLTTDQRGPGFQRIVNTTVDIGAIEVGTAISYRLNVNKTGGNGLVTSLPAGINCGPTCSALFPDGNQVTLTAKANAGYSFTGWAGDCTGTTLTCTVTLDATRNVTALFNNTPTLLTVTKGGNGAGTVTGDGIACGTDCNQTYPSGATVTLTAAPTTGSSFYEWTGCDSVNTARKQCTVTMAKARTVKATFAKPALLTVKKAGLGAGTVASLPLGIFCGADCNQIYRFNTVVYLMAAPATGSAFGSWQNCPLVTTYAGIKVCSVLMNQDRTVTATFVKQ